MSSNQVSCPFLFFRERDRFSESDLTGQLKNIGFQDSGLAARLLRIWSSKDSPLPVPLKKKGQKNGTEDDDSSADEITGIGDYYFEFVGIQEYRAQKTDGQSADPEKNFLICCVPKYFPFSMQNFTVVTEEYNALKKHLRKVLLVLWKYGREQDRNDMLDKVNPEDETQGSLLALSISLIQDYLLEGPYTNSEVRYEQNGYGEIDWQKTIDVTLPMLQNKRPFYVNYFTRERRTNTDTLITHLHECIISECSNMLKSNGVAELLDLETPEPYDGTLDDFGDAEMQKVFIDRELSVQYVTRKQNVLKMMRDFVCKNEKMTSEPSLQMFGTKKFENVWEKIISKVFGDQNDENIPVGVNKTGYNLGKSATFRNVMPYPVIVLDGDKEKKFKPPQTQKTDFVKLEDKTFCILDAKYYVPDFKHIEKETVQGVPGVQDVNKQHLYHLAYKKMIANNQWETLNAFLMPELHDAEREMKNGKIGYRIGEARNPIFDELEILRAPGRNTC